MLEKLPDSSPLDWIERTVTPRWPMKPGPACVMHLVPPIFEAYVKIRHAVLLDETITDPRRTYDDGASSPFPLDDLKDEPEVAEVLRKAVSEPGVRAYLQYESVPVPDGAPRLTWPEIAERLGVAVHAEDDLEHLFKRAGFESWPRQMVPSDEGRMDQKSSEALSDCLALVSEPGTAYFWVPWGSSSQGYDDQDLYRGSPQDFRLFHQGGEWRLTPEYCWHESRSWLIWTDREVHYSVAAGPVPLIQAILDHPALDAVRVEPSTSLTGFEARPN